MLYKLKHFYYGVKDWFRNCCNKNHFKTVWKTFEARPWDHSYTYEVLKYRLIEAREYFVKSDIIVQESIDKIVRQIDLALSLYDIMSGEKSVGHWEYEWEENINDVDDGKSGKLNRLKYISERYVNLRNSHRFTNHECLKEYYIKCPNELYEEKARRLFWRVMEQYSNNWWD